MLALGGTFDHLHAGHEKFLRFASEKSDRLMIGITSNTMAKKKTWPQTLQSFSERVSAVEKFCKQHKYPFEIIKITDIYGNTLKNQNIDGLAVTTETLRGGEAINQARKKLGLKELPIEMCALVNDQSGQAIHSERIRAGEISRQGFVYRQLFQKTISLSDEQRKILQNIPFATVHALIKTAKDLPTCVVGDQALLHFREQKWPYDLAVFDNFVQRNRVSFHQTIVPDFQVKNPAGKITQILAKTLQTALVNNEKHVFVEGEEDLAALVLIMILPLGSMVYFGLPNQGLAGIKVDEKIKDQLLGIVCVSGCC